MRKEPWRKHEGDRAYDDEDAKEQREHAVGKSSPFFLAFAEFVDEIRQQHRGWYERTDGRKDDIGDLESRVINVK